MKRLLSSLVVFLLLAISAFSQTRSRPMATYSNEKCGFSFNYPDDFVVQKKFVPSKKNVPECSLKLVFLQRGKVQHAISLRVETKTFDEEANALGLEKSASGWVSS